MEAFNTFLGIESDYDKSKVVILPVPYEGTVSYGKGTAKGPEAIIEASKFIELYDEELDKEILEIFTLEALEAKDNPKDMIDAITERTKQLLDDNKFVVGLGGEHSITLGFVNAIKEKFPKLSVLQLDAHTDLRDEYEESKFSHACVMKRISEFADITQVGIRSMCKEEVGLSKNIFFAKDMEDDSWMDKAVDTLNDDVYITFDIDAFDPSIMPATGTPEPGGMNWYQVLKFLKKVFEKKNVVGFDCVELAPINGLHHADFTAAKIVYKMIGYKF